jgi:hypothetical protein
MSQIEPPRLPTWMLEHLKGGGSHEALAGDLIQEFHRGRSVVWYWRQVLAVILIGWLTSIRDHRNLVVFTVLWSILSPGWTVVAMRIVERQAEAWHIWRLDWPWSSLCSTAMFFAPGLIFIWVGVSFYVFAQISSLKGINYWRFGRSLLLSASLFIGISGALAASMLFLQMPGHTEGQRHSTLSIAPAAPYFLPKSVGGGLEVTVTRDRNGVATVQSTTRVYVEPDSLWPQEPFQLDHYVLEGGTLSPWDAITESGLWAIVNRLPLFLSAFIALWATRRAASELKGTVM